MMSTFVARWTRSANPTVVLLVTLLPQVLHAAEVVDLWPGQPPPSKPCENEEHVKEPWAVPCVCRATQLITPLEKVRLGLGASVVPRMAACGDTSGERRYLEVQHEAARREIALAWRVDRSRPRAARELAAILCGSS